VFTCYVLVRLTLWLADAVEGPTDFECLTWEAFVWSYDWSLLLTATQVRAARLLKTFAESEQQQFEVKGVGVQTRVESQAGDIDRFLGNTA